MSHPEGAIKHISELKEGQTIYSVTGPHPGIDLNTKDLVPYIYTGGLDDHGNICLREKYSEESTTCNVIYRNVDGLVSHGSLVTPVKGLHLFTNYFFALGYYLRFVKEQT